MSILIISALHFLLPYLRKRMITIIVVSVIVLTYNIAQSIEIPLYIQEINSGARANSMADAFLAVSDDPTAMSYNPAGLVQITKPLFMFDFGFNRKEERYYSDSSDFSADSDSLSQVDMNILGMSYPINNALNLGFSYSRIFSLSQNGQFIAAKKSGASIDYSEEKYEIDRDCDIYAIGISLGMRLNSKISAGLTLHYMNDNAAITKCKLKTNKQNTYTLLENSYVSESIVYNESCSYDGLRTTIGLLWNPIQNIGVGFVYQPSFVINIDNNANVTNQMETLSIFKDRIQMPSVFGIGFSYKVSKIWMISSDIKRTDWQEYLTKNKSNNDISPITFESSDKSDINAVYQIKLGMEYLLSSEQYNTVIPIRAGIFYKPLPASKNPSNIWGISFGSGFSLQNYEFDISYQFSLSAEHTLDGMPNNISQRNINHYLSVSIAR